MAVRQFSRLLPRSFLDLTTMGLCRGRRRILSEVNILALFGHHVKLAATAEEIV